MIMSEIKKNIETCRGEDVLAEVSAAPQDPHFGSLVNEALDPLKQQALHQAGYDGYSEVIEQHKPYTFASAIIQMKSNLLLLLRALWQYPFGSGTLRSLSDDASLRSLSDMWQHYITRLQGNETYGIPSRLSSLTDLPSAPLLLADRKIVSIGVPDGIGIMQLATSKPAGITAIGDDQVYEYCYKPQLDALISALPNLNEMNIHCKRMTGFGYTGGARWFPSTITKINGKTNELYLPELERMEESAYSALPSENRDFKVWNFPAMKYCRCSFWNGSNGCDWVEEILMPVIESMGGYACDPFALNFTALRKVVWGKVSYIWFSESSFYQNCQNIIHLEYGEGIARNINISNWSPTNALDASRTDLIEEGSTAQNNLDQFLSNFRDYIALRLATYTGSNGPTLTLSQAVYDAIKDESHLFVFDEGTMTIYAYLTNIKHWTVTK